VVRGMSKISRGEGGGNIGRVSIFLRYQKREGQEKMGCIKDGGRVYSI